MKATKSEIKKLELKIWRVSNFPREFWNFKNFDVEKFCCWKAWRSILCNDACAHPHTSANTHTHIHNANVDRSTLSRRNRLNRSKNFHWRWCLWHCTHLEHSRRTHFTQDKASRLTSLLSLSKKTHQNLSSSMIFIINTQAHATVIETRRLHCH